MNIHNFETFSFKIFWIVEIIELIQEKAAEKKTVTLTDSQLFTFSELLQMSRIQNLVPSEKFSMNFFLWEISFWKKMGKKCSITSTFFISLYTDILFYCHHIVTVQNLPFSWLLLLCSWEVPSHIWGEDGCPVWEKRNHRNISL